MDVERQSEKFGQVSVSTGTYFFNTTEGAPSGRKPSKVKATEDIENISSGNSGDMHII